MSLKKSLLSLANKFGYEIKKYDKNNSEYPSDFSNEDIEIIKSVIPFTMTSVERIFSLIRSVEYIVKNKIGGSIVECGVWKGGSMITVAKSLMMYGDTSRHLYLFDTFEGMPKPKDVDISVFGMNAKSEFERLKKENNAGSGLYCASLEEVKKNLSTVGYDWNKIHFIKGKVEDTINQNIPDEIAILRLDTDWYESTLYELEYLFPHLKKGGVIIIDDYGHWRGARKAVDEYIDKNQVQIFLNRIDYTGRIGIKI